MADQHVTDTLTEPAQSEDTHQAAYDEPSFLELLERVDEAQQVLEDEGGRGTEAQYARGQIGAHFTDFTAVVTAAASD